MVTNSRITDEPKKRAKARRLIIDAKANREERSEFTSAAIAGRHGTNARTVNNIRKTGRAAHLPDETVRLIRAELVKREKIDAAYKSWAEIGELCGVSRCVVNRWARELGLIDPERSEKKRLERVAPKPVEMPKVPAFLTMRLSRNPGVSTGYY